jgi:hypothetical protein
VRGLPLTAAVVSCHVEDPLNDRVWGRFAQMQRARVGGFRIAALLRPPCAEADEREDVWLDRAVLAARNGPLGHHTHFGGATVARPPNPATAAERVRREAEWLRARGLAPRFFCGGGWFMNAPVAEVLSTFGYVDCSATAFSPSYLRPGSEHVKVPGPCWLLLNSGHRLLELPSTHSLKMAVRRALSPRRMRESVIHVYFHDWNLLDRRRAHALRAILAVLGRRCRPLDLDELADEAPGWAPDVSLDLTFKVA